MWILAKKTVCWPDGDITAALDGIFSVFGLTSFVQAAWQLQKTHCKWFSRICIHGFGCFKSSKTLIQKYSTALGNAAMWWPIPHTKLNSYIFQQKRQQQPQVSGSTIYPHMPPLQSLPRQVKKRSILRRDASTIWWTWRVVSVFFAPLGIAFNKIGAENEVKWSEIHSIIKHFKPWFEASTTQFFVNIKGISICPLNGATKSFACPLSKVLCFNPTEPTDGALRIGEH